MTDGDTDASVRLSGQQAADKTLSFPWADPSLIAKTPGSPLKTFHGWRPRVIPSCTLESAQHLVGKSKGAQRDVTASKSEDVNSLQETRNHHMEISVLWRLVHGERAMRQAAERRAIEEREEGMREIIVLKASYGARLLHAILLESLEAQTTSGKQRPNKNRADGKWPELSSPNSRVRSTGKKTWKNPKQVAVPTPSSPLRPSYEHLQEENQALREEVERYKMIDTQDRLELNEMHRNMRVVIDRLICERAALHAELSKYKAMFDATPVATVPSSEFEGLNKTSFKD